MSGKRQKVEFSARDRMKRINEIRRVTETLIKWKCFSIMDEKSFINAKPEYVQVSDIPFATMFVSKCLKRFIVKRNDPNNNFKKYSYIRKEYVDILQDILEKKYYDRCYDIDRIREMPNNEIVLLEYRLAIISLDEFLLKTQKWGKYEG